MNKMYRALLGMLLTGLAGCVTAPPVQQASLYERLGGSVTIASVVDRLWLAVNDDERVRHLFANTSREEFSQRLNHFLCLGTGGPCQVLDDGGDTATAVRHPSNVGYYRALAEGMLVSLDHLDVPMRERNEVMTLFAGIKNIMMELAQASTRATERYSRTAPRNVGNTAG